MTRPARLSLFLAGTACAALLAAGPHAQEPDALPPLVSAEQFDTWLTELSNWGRWGPDDELGAANLITPAKRAEAAALVTEGFTVSLASERPELPHHRQPLPGRVVDDCGQPPGRERHDRLPVHPRARARRTSTPSPTSSSTARCGTATTSTALVTMEEGATKNSIMAVKDGLVTRGVLYDIPRLKGVPWLEPGHPHHGRGSRGVGGDGRRARRPRRRLPDPLGTLGPPGRPRAVRHRPGGGGPRQQRHPVAQGARRRDRRLGDARLHAAAGGRPPPHGAPQLRPDHPGHPGPRPRRLSGPGQCRCRAQPLGVHDHHRAPADSRTAPGRR